MCMMTFLITFVSGFAQMAISVSNEITTSLIFPCSIKHIDRGTQSVLVQLVNEMPNILLVKASAENFKETNLSVVTDDGDVYSFLVSYVNKPTMWVYHLPENNKSSIASYAKGILDNSKTIRGIKDEKWDIKSSVIGIYIKNNTIYYQLKIQNDSPLDYDIDLMRFFIEDRKRAKSTAIQEIDLIPEYLVGNNRQIIAYGNTIIVVALEKFTIPDAKYLGIQIMEKNGGRHLFMKLGNKKILQAIALPDYN